MINKIPFIALQEWLSYTKRSPTTFNTDGKKARFSSQSVSFYSGGLHAIGDSLESPCAELRHRDRLILLFLLPALLSLRL